MGSRNSYMQKNTISSTPARSRWLTAFLIAVILSAMATRFYHPYLFSPDEPREAEIAREMLKNGNWITPHLSGLPFLEKPPLYYNIVAAAYAITGSITPAVARSVSIAFGMIMLAVVFLIAQSWQPGRRKWLAVLLLLAMPQFYKYSHQIVLDIAVGAFCTMAILAFMYRFLFAPSENKKWPLYLFYFACAAAFLTKGAFAIFQIAVPIAAFTLIARRWDILKKIFSPLPMLVFIIPVGIWIYLYYQQGGLPYLYEHFVNNTIGRFFRIHMELEGAKFYHTDLGNQEAWHYYISNLPRMLGPALAVIPFTIIEATKKTLPIKRNREPQGQTYCFLLIWAILPAVILSFSSIKATSYLLPQYAAIALLTAAWLDNNLPKQNELQHQGIAYLSIVFLSLTMNIFLYNMDVRTYRLISLIPLAFFVPAIWILFKKQKLTHATFAILAVSLYMTMIYNSSNVLYAKRTCEFEFANDVWSHVGDEKLYIYKPDDGIRGNIQFTKKRVTPELHKIQEIKNLITAETKNFILTNTDTLKELDNDPTTKERYKIHPLKQHKGRQTKTLISNTLPDVIPTEVEGSRARQKQLPSTQ